MNVDAYGKPFNNWFKTNENYMAKIDKMENYVEFMSREFFISWILYGEMLAFKNSRCIPIYFADPHVKNDLELILS